MTLLTHLIRKDVRAVAIVSLIWIFLMAIEAALQLTGAAMQPRSDPGRPTLLDTLRNFLPFVEVAMAARIVATVIQEDPLVDPRAFWLTRPIPRARLFLAKLIAIALVIVAPALMALGVVLAWYHVPLVYMMRAGFELVLWMAFPLLVLIAAATLTSTVSGYLVILIGTLVLSVSIMGLMETFGPPPVRVYEAPLPRFADPAAPVTVILILIAGFCAAIHQFYRRRDARVALGGIALVVGVATLVGRNWPGFAFFEAPGTATGAWTANTRLRLLDDRRMTINSYHPRELHTVSAPVVLDGLPDGYTASPFTLNGTLTRADGTALRSGRAMAMQVEAKGEYQPSLTLAYGSDPIAAGPTSWEAWPVLLELPFGHRTKAADNGPGFYVGTYAGTFMYRIAHHEQVASLRLDRGEGRTDGPRGITVVDVRDFGNVCRVTLQVANTELAFAGPQEPVPGYYFVDRRTGQKLRASLITTRGGLTGPLRLGRPGRRIFAATFVEWDVKNPRDDGKVDASACADMQLIFVRTIAIGTLTRSFELPDFRVQPSQDTFFRR